MSLSIYLTEPTVCICKKCGEKNEIGGTEVYYANITHNLAEMAEALMLYIPLWSPDGMEIKQAKQLEPFLDRGIKLMQADPDTYREFNSENGWGTYEQFLPWLITLRNACDKNPEALVTVSK